MVTTNNGGVINNIVNIGISNIYSEYIAFQDSDGAIMHIKKTELKKLYFYMVNNSPLLKTDDIQHMSEQELNYFFEKR